MQFHEATGPIEDRAGVQRLPHQARKQGRTGQGGGAGHLHGTKRGPGARRDSIGNFNLTRWASAWRECHKVRPRHRHARIALRPVDLLDGLGGTIGSKRGQGLSPQGC